MFSKYPLQLTGIYVVVVVVVIVSLGSSEKICRPILTLNYSYVGPISNLQLQTFCSSVTFATG